MNSCLLADLRSSALLSLLPAFFRVLRWIQFVLIEIQRLTAKCFNFSQTNISLKVAKSCYISYQIVFQTDSFSNNLNRFMLDFMYLCTRRCNFQGRFLQWTTAFEPFLQYLHLRFLILGKQKKTSARNTSRIRASRPDLFGSQSFTVALFLLFF